MKNIIRTKLGLLAVLGGVAATGPVLAENAKPAAEADSATYNNWITLGIGSPFISRDGGAFSARHQMSRRVAGGIEDFHWEQSVGKDGLFELNGHGIYDENNYGVDLKYADPNKGYLKAGFEQFRTWSDDSGGYFPGGTNRWFELNRDLTVDRGHIWFEAVLTLPDAPQISFRYDNEYRDGEKASTVWGDSLVAATPGVYPVTGATRNFVPAFLGVDERRDTFALKLKHHIGKTDFTIGGSYTRNEFDNARYIPRRPGESTAQRYVTEHQKQQEDVFNAHGYTETRFNDRTKLTLGGSFTTLSTEIGGSRIYGTQYDAPLGSWATLQNSDSGYYNVMGGASIDQYVANINLMITPLTNLVIVPSLRIEKENVNGLASYRGTRVSSGLFSTNGYTTLNTAARDPLEVTEAIEARYTGIKNLALYARAEVSQASEDRMESAITTSLINPALTTNTPSNSNWERLGQKYTVGANWFVMPRVNMGGQYYYKVSQNEWTSGANKTTQDYTTHDLNYRLTVRPTSDLSFVSRYDFQLSTVDHKVSALPEVEASEFAAHILSQSINWTPTPRLYLQLNASYAWDAGISTRADGAYGVTNFVPSLENGYFTGSATMGYALDEVSDLTLQYNYYHADNYENNYLWTQPYGASAEEHGITATISRQLNKRTTVSIKYGYFTANDETSGGNNDYDAHMLFGTVQYRF